MNFNLKSGKMLIILMLMVVARNVYAAHPNEPIKSTLQTGDVVANVEIRDSKDAPVMLPGFGDQYLLLFYSDPEVPKRNSYFIEQMKTERFNDRENFLSYGIVNLKDARFYPNNLVRMGIRREEKKYEDQQVKIYTDPSHIVKSAWNLGEVDNEFAVIFLDKSGEVLFYQAEELSNREADNLIRLIYKTLGEDMLE